MQKIIQAQTSSTLQIRGENFSLAWLNQLIKKWNTEHGEKPSKTIMFIPLSPIVSTATTSVPHDKTTLLSSLVSRVADLKAKLGAEDKVTSGDEGNLGLQQFLAEIKEKYKELLFTEQIDEGYLGGTHH